VRADASALAGRWREHLAGWAIPPEIERAANSSPWALPARSFVRRADQLLADPGGASLAASRAALAGSGTVLDVGAGAGAASLPLADAATALTAVDTDAGLLAELAVRARRLGLPVTTVHGRWPDVAGRSSRPT
jgi:2-polyprenyl-3-methyl-5-hydroxy-6-metoxy-1,4-benzoquinol methylase